MKKTISTILAIVMVSGVFTAVPVFADWSPRAGGDGYDRVLADLDFENGTLGAGYPEGMEGSSTYKPVSPYTADEINPSVADAEDAELTDGDSHGNVLKIPMLYQEIVENLEADDQFRVWTTADYMDQNYSASLMQAKEIEFSQVKFEADILLTSTDRTAILGLRYTPNGESPANLDLVSIDGDGSDSIDITADEWHNLVIYLDNVNKTYDIYLDDELLEKDVAFSAPAGAPCGLFLGWIDPPSTGSDNYTGLPEGEDGRKVLPAIYADNLKFSVPEYCTAGGLSVYGTPLITTGGFDDPSEFGAGEGNFSIFGNVSYNSIVSANDKSLPDASEHGNVLKMTRSSQAEMNTSTSLIGALDHQPSGGNLTNAKKVVFQADILIPADPVASYDFRLRGILSGDEKQNNEGNVVRFMRGKTNLFDGTATTTANEIVCWEGDTAYRVKTFELNKWYTVMIAADITASESASKTYSVWIDDECVWENKPVKNTVADYKYINGMRMINGFTGSEQTIYYDNIQLWTGGECSPSWTPKFVLTRQGEESYKLAYVLPYSLSSVAELIAATYDNNSLSGLNIARTESSLTVGGTKLLLTGFTRKNGETLKKFLWKDFSTIEPLTDME